MKLGKRSEREIMFFLHLSSYFNRAKRHNIFKFKNPILIYIGVQKLNPRSAHRSLWQAQRFLKSKLECLYQGLNALVEHSPHYSLTHS